MGSCASTAHSNAVSPGKRPTQKGGRPGKTAVRLSPSSSLSTKDEKKGGLPGPNLGNASADKEGERYASAPATETTEVSEVRMHNQDRRSPRSTGMDLLLAERDNHEVRPRAPRRLPPANTSKIEAILKGPTPARRHKVEVEELCRRGGLAQMPSLRMEKAYPNGFLYLKGHSFKEDFTELSVIGAGSFGSVKLVRLQTGASAGTLCAAKSMWRQGSDNFKKGSLKETEVRNEISTMAALDHPNIVRLYRAYEEADQYTLIMQYARGGELFSRIKKKRRFTEVDASIVMVDLLAALAYLHEKDIAHRDLKPENLLYETEEENSRLLIADFGFAKMKSEARLFSTFCGSPVYIAPEVIGGRFSMEPQEAKRHRRYGVECDLWSAGVILYILLCGYPPFFGRSSNITMRKIRSGIYTFPDKDWKCIDPGAKDLISRLLVMNPKGRMSASEALTHEWISSKAGDRLGVARRELRESLGYDLLHVLGSEKEMELHTPDVEEMADLSTIDNMSQRLDILLSVSQSTLTQYMRSMDDKTLVKRYAAKKRRGSVERRVEETIPEVSEEKERSSVLPGTPDVRGAHKGGSCVPVEPDVQDPAPARSAARVPAPVERKGMYQKEPSERVLELRGPRQSTGDIDRISEGEAARKGSIERRYSLEGLLDSVYGRDYGDRPGEQGGGERQLVGDVRYASSKLLPSIRSGKS